MASAQILPSIPDLSAVSLSILQQELRRRDEAPAGEDSRPECGSGPKGSYNMGLHVFAVALILILSTFACSFPIAARRFPKLPIPHRFLFISRHFGTGVLIATAFVHLLPTAFVSLTDPCLPPFWNEGYPAMAGLIAMISVFVVVGIEMFFATKGAGHVHGDYAVLDEPSSTHHHHNPTAAAAAAAVTDSERSPTLVSSTKPRYPKTGGIRHFRTNSLADEEEHTGLVDGAATNGTHREEDDSDIDLDEFDDVAATLRSGSARGSPPGYDAAMGGAGGAIAAPSAAQDAASREEQRMLLQCLLLEAGILFHSVFIGMALSVATGTPFLVLLVAISFHQTFEGLALGSRIAAIRSFAPASPKPWLMALAYGTTTPIGQVIGLGVHNLYDPASQAGLLTVGMMNAISSGLLLFAGLVELVAEDFLSEKSYDTLRGKSRLEACAAVVAGSMLMAAVGAFA